MFSFKSIVLIAAVFTIEAECSGVAVPAVAAAPLVAPAAVGYAHAVPQNIPPYASQVSVVNRALSPLVAAPYAAAPYAAAPYPVAQYAAAQYAPYSAAPYFAGPGQVLPAPLAAPYAAPYAYGAAAPLIRAAPFGYPAYVR
ncbi:unnamed protein product [Arctia plantaginis]|uniref:Uncharacterized protein n=1 Tax=Arctia plantaginis TaxID=874455 RepID=A0A8S1BK51_ARCPL|nr:unnamed protein product [Arctia plantaginis]CAB3259830.1 unnamed protein product [Arctia plantaginis]